MADEKTDEPKDHTGTRFFIAQTLWSNSERRNIMPGERVLLDDLTPRQIELLKRGNVITEAEALTPAAKAAAAQLAANEEAAKLPPAHGRAKS